MEKKRTTLRGKIVMSHIEYPHYELECDDGNNYALFGNIDYIDKLGSNQVEVTGKLTSSASTNLRNIPFDIETIRESH
jgi:hypothetical protein